MLRDLDKRKVPGQTMDRGDSPGLIPAVPIKVNPVYRWIFWLILVIGVSFLAAFLFKVYSSYDIRVQQTVTEKQVAEATLRQGSADRATVAPANNQAILPLQNTRTSVQSIEISEMDADARIEIKLSAAVDHKIIKKADSELLIQLPNTELKESLPPLAGHPLINTIDVASDKGNLQLGVTLASQVTFQTYLLNKEGYALLVIELMAPEAAASRAIEPGAKTIAQIDLQQMDAAKQMPDAVLPEQPAGSDTRARVNDSSPSVFAKTTREKSLSERDRETSQQALSSLRSGKAEEAISLLSGLIGQHPQVRLSRETLVMIYLKLQRFDDARYALDKALVLSPEDSALIKLQARLWMATNEQEKALLLLNRQKNENRNDLEYLSLLASLNQQQGQHVDAVNIYRDLLQRFPARANWWVGQAISLEALGMKQDALGAYLQARRVPQIDARLKQYTDERIRTLN